MASYFNLLRESRTCAIAKMKTIEWKLDKRGWWNYRREHNYLPCPCAVHNRTPLDVLRYFVTLLKCYFISFIYNQIIRRLNSLGIFEIYIKIVIRRWTFYLLSTLWLWHLTRLPYGEIVQVIIKSKFFEGAELANRLT